MSEYANLALKAEGFVFLLTEGEKEDLSPSWIEPHLIPPTFQIAIDGRDATDETITADVSFRPNEATRLALISLAENCADSQMGETAVEFLVKHWPDEATRQLLVSLAENIADSQAGAKAVMSLAEYWPDEVTWQLLFSLAQNSPDTQAGCASVISLTDYRRDDAVRQFLRRLIQEAGRKGSVNNS
jgi:hypothetical protein